jgi:LCP family protein required for cell wall assembly
MGSEIRPHGSVWQHSVMTTGPAPHAEDPRSSLAALLSFLVPGLGQAYNGRRALAAMLVLPVVLIGLIVLALAADGEAALTRLLSIRFLAGLLVLDVALLGWRLVAIAQAHGERAPLGLRHWTGWVTGLLLVITLGMHLLPGWYVVKAIDTIGAVSLEGSGVSRGGVGGSGINIGLPGETSLPVPSDQPEPKGHQRINVLLVGVDSGPGRGQALTDTMLVVSIDPDGGPPAMISVPRDVYGTPLPDGRVYDSKLNSLMSFAASRPGEFPLGGAGTLKAAVGELLGIRIHYFGAVNLLGFRDAVDAIGGVDIVVQRTVNDPFYRNEYDQLTGFYLATGEHHLDGTTALAFARSRKGYGDSDFTRADRQQQLLAAIRQKLTAGNLVFSLPGLLDAVKNTITTDIPGDRLSWLAAAVQRADMANLQRVVLQPPDFMSARSNPSAGYILVPDLDAIRAATSAMLEPQSTRTPAPLPGD